MYNTRILHVKGVDIQIIDIIVISIFIVSLVSKFQSSYCAFENNVMWYVVVIIEVIELSYENLFMGKDITTRTPISKPFR